MQVERWTIPSGDAGRAEWLARRVPNINGTEISAAVGCSPFKTRFALYAEKAGLAVPDDRDNDAMRRGRIMEPSVAQAVLEEKPDWVIEKSTDYLWAPEWRLGCTPDFYVRCPERGRGVIQAKTTSKQNFEQEWQDGPPQWVVLQTLQEMMLTDLSWGAIAVLILEFPFKLDWRIYPFERHDGAETRLVEVAAQFWDDVTARRQPKPDYAQDASVIRALFPRDNGEAIDLTGDNRLPALCEEHERLKAIVGSVSGAQKQLDAVKAEIAEKLGAAAVGRFPGWQVSNKTQTRKATAETSFRVLRVKRIATERKAA